VTDQVTEPFELKIQIGSADIDEQGHVNNIVYLRWVQDVAIAHWKAAAAPEDQKALVWVVTRHEIDYRRAAMPGDEIVARTWVGHSAGLTFERHTEILRAADRKLLARSLTHWCPMNPSTMKPTDVSVRVRELFSLP